MIDLHTHILPGLDDGPASLEESLALARAEVADGIRVAAATPHVRADYPTTAGAMQEALDDLRAALAKAHIPLLVEPGGEIALDLVADLPEDELDRFRLGGTSDWLLVEFPYFGWPLELEERVAELQQAGFRVVLAHPERNQDVQAAPERLLPVVERGALVQLTAASVDGRLGRTTRRAAFALLEGGLAHLLASDAHAAHVRGAGMSAAVAAIGDAALTRWLTREVPAAVLRGGPFPEPPPPAAARGLRERLQRRLR